MLMAADNTSEVHPQSIQRAGILGRVQLVGNLFNMQLHRRYNNVCGSL